MNIILITGSRSEPVRRSIHARYQFVLLGLLGVSVLAGAAAAGYGVARWQRDGAYVSSWQARLEEQRKELAQVRSNAQSQVDALTARLAMLQSRVTRLDALGQKLIDASNIEASEFDFDSQPGLGGLPHPADGGESYQVPQLQSAIDALDARIRDRQRQLSVLENVLMDREFAAATKPRGEPIKKGWISSTYGYRKDPFTGKRAWHDGIDFAGRKGEEVDAVAAGVVTYAGKRWGYGNLVEITHSNGYVTRYGHNSKILVKEGQIVRRGDQIAEMGSTGRSTGPHVHLEVLKDGKSVNPWKYVHAER